MTDDKSITFYLLYGLSALMQGDYCRYLGSRFFYDFTCYCCFVFVMVVGLFFNA